MHDSIFACMYLRVGVCVHLQSIPQPKKEEETQPSKNTRGYNKAWTETFLSYLSIPDPALKYRNLTQLVHDFEAVRVCGVWCVCVNSYLFMCVYAWVCAHMCAGCSEIRNYYPGGVSHAQRLQNHPACRHRRRGRFVYVCVGVYISGYV